jgi:hypothetical protein
MKNRSSFFALVLLMSIFCSSSVFGQIALTLTAEKARFMRYEPIAVVLTVKNISGNTLVFDGDEPSEQGSIGFKIEMPNGRQCKQYSSGPGSKSGIPLRDSGLRLAPGQSKSLKILLNQFYDMQREGHYTITARLNHARLPKTHVSLPVSVDVQEGVEIMYKNIGLPSVNKDDVIKTIRLSLLRFSDVDEDIYCFRAEDDENVYAVHRLGSYIDGQAPQMEIDDSRMIHLLLQIRPRLYAYFIFGFRGRAVELLQKRFYISSDGAPPSLSIATGYLRVEHGRLAVEGVDYYETDPVPEK